MTRGKRLCQPARNRSSSGPALGTIRPLVRRADARLNTPAFLSWLALARGTCHSDVGCGALVLPSSNMKNDNDCVLRSRGALRSLAGKPDEAGGGRDMALYQIPVEALATGLLQPMPIAVEAGQATQPA